MKQKSMFQQKYALCIILSLCLQGIQANRTFTLTNKCQESVWFGFSGGSANARGSSRTFCNSSGDCQAGSQCYQTGDIRQCFWDNPTPQNGNFELKPNGQNTVTIPMYDDDNQIQWSGAVAGRTNCAGGACETADCGNGAQGCKPSQGFFQPATQAEFTLQKKTVDFYDIEVINGVNIPVSMQPTSDGTSETNDSFSCGNPGSKFPKAGAGACNWQFTPPSNDYIWVSAGGNQCQNDAACNGQSCGVSFNPGHDNLLQKTCGKKLGFWTADQICGIQRNFDAPFLCSSRLPAPQDAWTNWHLFACAGVPSCYQDGAQENCCGCANWDELGIQVPPETEKCKNKNTHWIERVQSTLHWLKKGCPSSYVYPYDDKSSTYTCAQMSNGFNTMNYEITFCPQNVQGQEIQE